jgi:hypothetical protein
MENPHRSCYGSSSPRSRRQGYHATVGLAVLDPVEQLFYLMVHPLDDPHKGYLTAVRCAGRFRTTV